MRKRDAPHCRRSTSLAALCLSLLLCVEAASAQPLDEPFVFGDADLTLLRQSDLLDQRFEKQGLVLHEPALDALLDRVGQAVLPDRRLERVTWTFRVLRDPSENAFALPNGSIYVHAGLFALLEREDQLASVLAHEAVHVSARHGYMANRDYRKKAAAINVLGLVAEMGGTSGSIGGAIVWVALGAVVPSILAATINGYSRELESEADTLAFQALVRSGYDPAAMVEAFERLELEFDLQVPRHFYNDHPKLAQRIAAANRLLAASRVERMPGRVAAAPLDAYQEATISASRLTVTLDMSVGRPRTALAYAKRLAERAPSAGHLTLVGDAYRTLGPWAEIATPDERTAEARKRADKEVAKYTAEEREQRMMATKEGQAAWIVNARAAEEHYARALATDERFGPAHRGLGLLFEKAGRGPEAIERYRRYLELAPEAPDASRIKARVDRLTARAPS